MRQLPGIPFHWDLGRTLNLGMPWMRVHYYPLGGGVMSFHTRETTKMNTQRLLASRRLRWDYEQCVETYREHLNSDYHDDDGDGQCSECRRLSECVESYSIRLQD